jgi:hypothetical protein
LSTDGATLRVANQRLRLCRSAAMTTFLGTGILGLLLKIWGGLFLLGPIVLRLTFRYKAKVNPQMVSPEALPQDVQQFMTPRLPGITALGFQPVGYINLGSIAPNTQAYMALLSNSQTREWADVSVVKAPTKLKGYIEFITRCSDDSQVDTNTNSTAPVLFPSPCYHLFRFPQINDAFTLYRAHRMLVQEKIGGSRPELPTPGQELNELKRRLERYGPRQRERGYTYLEADGQNFRLTWKGAILGAWRSIWPISVLRGWGMQNRSEVRLGSLGFGEYRSTSAGRLADAVRVTPSSSNFLNKILYRPTPAENKRVKTGPLRAAPACVRLQLSVLELRAFVCEIETESQSHSSPFNAHVQGEDTTQCRDKKRGQLTKHFWRRWLARCKPSTST